MAGRLSTPEYIALVAVLMSIGAMGTDVMLPALSAIGKELGAPNANDVQFIVTGFFLGMAAGQLLVGPLADSIGRKPVILFGYAVFVIGCLVSMTTDDWTLMLAARVLQGVGAAAPRIVTVAMVRDEYEGRAMARIMSIVMAAFIIVPILAPAVGQGLIALGGWRATFAGLTALAVLATLWLALRQQETLAPVARRPFRLKTVWRGLGEIVRIRAALGYTLATGLLYGMFIAYLGTAPQIFQDVFGAGEKFALYFAIGAAAFGAASLVNAKLVMRLGMRRLTWLALLGLTALSIGFGLALALAAGAPPLWLFLLWQVATFFCVGITFGNLNALTLEPLGHMAGLGAAFAGALATFMSLPLAWEIGRRFDGTVLPLVAGFAILGAAACAVFLWTNRGLSFSDA